MNLESAQVEQIGRQVVMTTTGQDGSTDRKAMSPKQAKTLAAELGSVADGIEATERHLDRMAEQFTGRDLLL